MWMGVSTLHTSNIKGQTFEFARASRPASCVDWAQRFRRTFESISPRVKPTHSEGLFLWTKFSESHSPGNGKSLVQPPMIMQIYPRHTFFPEAVWKHSWISPLRPLPKAAFFVMFRSPRHRSRILLQGQIKRKSLHWQNKGNSLLVFFQDYETERAVFDIYPENADLFDRLQTTREMVVSTEREDNMEVMTMGAAPRTHSDDLLRSRFLPKKKPHARQLALFDAWPMGNIQAVVLCDQQTAWKFLENHPWKISCMGTNEPSYLEWESLCALLFHNQSTS